MTIKVEGVVSGLKHVRIHAIDLLKFLAALLITNSHMSSLYPEKFSFLASGGAIGDSLFFFCSGFLLIRGQKMDFMNWYKRRINRIFPTVFAVALIGLIFLGKNPTFKDVIVNGGGWFVQAIFVFYALFWFVKRFCVKRLWLIYAILTAVILVWFIFYWDKNLSVFAYGTYLRWPFFFMMMLLGASISNGDAQNKEKQKQKGSLWIWIAGLLFLFLLFNGYQFLGKQVPVLKKLQLMLLPIAMAITICLYKVCSNPLVLKIYLNKYVYWVVYGISACCLEIYLTGRMSFWLGIKLMDLFPLNILLTFILIFIIAYLTKISSNFLSQTFKTEKYDWKAMVKL